jgi:uncharacterized membrane protein YoaK (UPF0700 family)
MRRWLPLLLSIVAGSVDTTSFLALSHLFAAHVTRNLVVLAASLVSDSPQGTIAKLLSVPWFIIVVGSVSLLGEAARRRQRFVLRWLLGIEALLLALAFVIAMTMARTENGKLVLGLTLITAMAVQNALNPVVLGNAPATTVMTTNLTKLVADAARLLPWVSVDAQAEQNWKSQLHELLWPTVGFLGGCAMGAATFSTCGFIGLAVPPMLIALAAISVERA